MNDILSLADIDQISAKDDFKISVLREDGQHYGTLTWIWNVQVDGELYVRAYHGTKSRWYQSALKSGEGRITGAGLERRVKLKPVSGTILEQIDAAYREKYSSSSYLGSMISVRAKAATIRVSSWKEA